MTGSLCSGALGGGGRTCWAVDFSLWSPALPFPACWLSHWAQTWGWINCHTLADYLPRMLFCAGRMFEMPVTKSAPLPPRCRTAGAAMEQCSVVLQSCVGLIFLFLRVSWCRNRQHLSLFLWHSQYQTWSMVLPIIIFIKHLHPAIGFSHMTTDAILITFGHLKDRNFYWEFLISLAAVLVCLFLYCPVCALVELWQQSIFIRTTVIFSQKAFCQKLHLYYYCLTTLTCCWGEEIFTIDATTNTCAEVCFIK